MTTPTLTYFDGRGKGEGIRLCLAAAGVEFNDVTVQSREQWLKLSKDWIFGQAPCLEIDGMKIIQSGSILRYLAKRYQLNGSNREEETLIDQHYEGSRDFLTPFAMIGFKNTIEEQTKELQEKTLPKYMPIYEKMLSSSGGKYLVGSKLSLADIGVLEVLISLEDYLKMEPFQKYPHVKIYYENLMATPWAKNFMKKYRKGRNHPEYVQKVMKILGFA